MIRVHRKIIQFAISVIDIMQKFDCTLTKALNVWQAFYNILYEWMFYQYFVR